MQPIQIQLSQNKKEFSAFFSGFPVSTWNLEYFEIKPEPQRWFFSEIIDWKKRTYLNAQKATKSEHLSVVNILKDPKHWLNLHGSVFVIFFDHSQRKSAQKTLF